MSDRKKTDPRISIIVTYEDDNECVESIKKEVRSFESAEEALGKLERAYKEITKEDE